MSNLDAALGHQRTSRAVTTWLFRNHIWLFLARAILLFSVSSPYFLTVNNLSNVLTQGAFIGILEPAPAADVVDQDGLEIRLAGANLGHQVLQRLASVEAQSRPAGILEDAQDLQTPGSGVAAKDVELVFGGILLMIGRHPDIGDGRQFRFRRLVGLIRMGRPSIGHPRISLSFPENSLRRRING